MFPSPLPARGSASLDDALSGPLASRRRLFLIPLTCPCGEAYCPCPAELPSRPEGAGSIERQPREHGVGEPGRRRCRTRWSWCWTKCLTSRYTDSNISLSELGCRLAVCVCQRVLEMLMGVNSYFKKKKECFIDEHRNSAVPRTNHHKPMALMIYGLQTCCHAAAKGHHSAKLRT